MNWGIDYQDRLMVISKRNRLRYTIIITMQYNFLKAESIFLRFGI